MSIHYHINYSAQKNRTKAMQTNHRSLIIPDNKARTSLGVKKTRAHQLDGCISNYCRMHILIKNQLTF